MKTAPDPLPPAPNFLVRYVHQITGVPGQSGPAENVFNVQWPAGGVVLSDATTVNNKFKDFYTAIASFFPTGCTITVGSRVVEYFTPADLVLAVTPQTVSGSGIGGNLPVQNACCLAWRTAKAGPRYRGRTFIGPLYLGAIGTNGALTSGVQSTVNSAAATLVSAISAIASGPKLSVYSRWYGTSEEIIGGSCDSVMDTMRRRAL